jgi:hypothetical protein
VGKGRLEGRMGWQKLPFKEPLQSRYVKLVILNDYSNKGIASLAEFSIVPAK